MGDFFSRLAEKTLGVAPVVKPDLAPVFAASHSAAISEAVSLQEEGTTTIKSATTNAVQPRPNSNFGQQVVKDSSPPVPTRLLGSRPTSSNDGAASPDRSAVEIADGFTVPAVAPSASRSAVPEQAPVVDPLSLGKTALESKAAEPTTLTKISERIFAEPAVEFKPALQVSKMAAPAVQVTIGRVEVHAVLPSAPAPRIVERKAPARLTLEEYLRARNEGRR
ncbi:MAG TPA: hypothetical protein VK603_06550 [Candidatus Saccharimonadales bacterium]|nr:hypothetical protein [Candidatus Saccharimonadales bacterium]